MGWKGRVCSWEAREHRGGGKGWAQRNSPRVGEGWTWRARERETARPVGAANEIRQQGTGAAVSRSIWFEHIQLSPRADATLSILLA